MDQSVLDHAILSPSIWTQLGLGVAGLVGAALAHTIVVLVGRLVFARAAGGQGPLGIVADTARLMFITLWLVLAHALAIGLWTFVFLRVGAFNAVEPALYIAMVTYTTLGSGDPGLPVEWRLLSGFVGASGFILFGLSVAILVDATHRLRLRRPD